MAQGPQRDLLKIIWQNFRNSLKPRRFTGDYIGKDYNGNKFFEIPAQGARHKPSRYFEAPKGGDFTNEMTGEWESWLRHRRKFPPTEEELSQNLATINMKKVNSKKLEEERAKELEAKGLPTQPAVRDKGYESYPKYEEYDSGDPSRHNK